MIYIILSQQKASTECWLFKYLCANYLQQFTKSYRLTSTKAAPTRLSPLRHFELRKTLDADRRLYLRSPLAYCILSAGYQAHQSFLGLHNNLAEYLKIAASH